MEQQVEILQPTARTQVPSVEHHETRLDRQQRDRLDRQQRDRLDRQQRETCCLLFGLQSVVRSVVGSCLVSAHADKP